VRNALLHMAAEFADHSATWAGSTAWSHPIHFLWELKQTGGYYGIDGRSPWSRTIFVKEMLQLYIKAN